MLFTLLRLVLFASLAMGCLFCFHTHTHTHTHTYITQALSSVPVALIIEWPPVHLSNECVLKTILLLPFSRSPRLLCR